MAEETRALATGLALAISFNPLFALLGSTLAAALAGVRSASHARVAWAVAVLASCWLVGDGLGVLAFALDVGDSVGGRASAAAGADWTAIALWAVGGLAVGYALPTWAGVFVGRRVTHGTGWLAAGSTAATACGALIALAALLSDAVA